MGQIEDLQLFVNVVDAGSISKASADMRIAKSAISRRLGLLEDRYATQLIDRRPGVWQVTGAGRELYQRATGLLASASEITADFSREARGLSGPLAVSLPRDFGMAFLQPAVAKFVADHPEIQLTVDFDDRRVDLERENYDLAVRVAREDDPSLVTQVLGRSDHRLFASPAYAAEHGMPKTPADLATHPLLHHGATRRATWPFIQDGSAGEISFQPKLNANSGQFLLEATKRGLGITLMPDFLAARDHAAGQLVEVLPDLDLAPLRVTLVYSPKRVLNGRMRAFIKVMAETCATLDFTQAAAG